MSGVHQFLSWTDGSLADPGFCDRGGQMTKFLGHFSSTKIDDFFSAAGEIFTVLDYVREYCYHFKRSRRKSLTFQAPQAKIFEISSAASANFCHFKRRRRKFVTIIDPVHENCYHFEAPQAGENFYNSRRRRRKFLPF